MQWRAAGPGFVGGRGGGASRRGKKFRANVAGTRSRRSRFPVRHAPSSPLMEPQDVRKRNAALVSRSLYRMSVHFQTLIAVLASMMKLMPCPQHMTAGPLHSASHAVPLRRKSPPGGNLREPCASRQSRSLSNECRPADPSWMNTSHRSGKASMLTSHRV